MRVAFIHNLKPGGARRTMAAHMGLLRGEVTELCLSPASEVRDDAIVVPVGIVAPRLTPMLRPPARYRDLVALQRAWRQLADRLNELAPDVIMAHPCQFLQCPPAVRWVDAPTVYFCHEYRRVDHDPDVRGSRRRRTRLLYAPLYGAERRSDMHSVTAPPELLTNSRYSAAGIR